MVLYKVDSIMITFCFVAQQKRNVHRSSIFLLIKKKGLLFVCILRSQTPEPTANEMYTLNMEIFREII